MAVVLAELPSSRDSSKPGGLQGERVVELDCKVSFGQSLRTDVADESESVTVLELRHRDDVAFEARRSRDSEVTTT